MEEFIMKTRIYLGEASLESIKSQKMNRTYIICDPFMEQSHKVDLVTDILKEKGVIYQVFSKVVPDPDITVVIKGIENMCSFHPDTVIAIGGGSALDTAKAVCQIYGEMKEKKKPYFIAIPTTSGTGSEVTSFAVISDMEAQAKYPLRDAEMLPDMAVLDPELTITVPPHITADTGMDVLTHALEAYVSTKANDFTDACGEKAVRMVWKYLKPAVRDGNNMEARERMHNASCLAGIAFNTASLGLCHSMAHALGARYHIPHGRCNAILLPYVIMYNAQLESAGECEALERYLEIARILGIEAGTKKAAIHRLVYHIRGLMKGIGISLNLPKIDIKKEEYEQSVTEMAKLAMEDNCTKTNPREPSVKEIEKIYIGLYEGGF
jgi:1-propanol dehydrogenase